MIKTVFNIIALLFLVTTLNAADSELLKDNFSTPDMPQRRAMRGDWKIANGVATCTQDDTLFKKYKDHGPIIFYDLPHTDATIRFSFKPMDAKAVVFTANGEQGHVFRFVMSATGVSIRAFPPGEEKSIALAMEKIPLKSGDWTPVEVQLKGSKATVKIGEHPAKTYEHPTLGRPKANLSLGFSYGALSVKDFVVTK